MSSIYLVGNWKLNNSPKETEKFMKALGNIDPGSVGIDEFLKAVVCPPSLSIDRAAGYKPGWLSLGAQDACFEVSGAYTGEVSPAMLSELEVNYVITGHSERRILFGETDEIVNKKVNRMLNSGLTPIVCVGENEIEREQGATFAVIELQLKKAFWGLDEQDLDKVIIAYEPVWAIGTGNAATPDDAEEVGKFIKDVMSSGEGSRNIPVLYGGSVNPDNVADFAGKGSIDGALVGGKSVEAGSYIELMEKVSEIN